MLADNKSKPKNIIKHFFSKEWNYGQVDTRKINFGSWKFFSYYNRKNILKRYLVSALMGVLIGIFSFFFLQKTGIYNLGASGFFQGVSRLTSFGLNFSGFGTAYALLVYNILFWVLNFAFNLPLALFGYFKIGKQFAYISIINIATSTVVGLILSSIPALNNFYIFENPLTFNEDLIKNNIQILQWFHVQKLPTNEFVNDSSKIIILLIYGIASGFFGSLPSTLIYVMGGSCGGTDWYLFYYSKKTMKFFGTISLYLNLLITLVSFVIGTYIPYVIFVVNNSSEINYGSLVSNFFSPILLATFLSAWIRRIVTNKFYPQFNVVLVKIYSSQIDIIRKIFLQEKLIHAFTINYSTGGYSLKKHPNIEIVCFYREIHRIVEMVRRFDNRCLIIAHPLISIQGDFRVQSDFD